MKQQIPSDLLVWLLNTSRALFGKREFQALLDELASAALELTQCDRTYVFLRDDTTGALQCRAGRNKGHADCRPVPRIASVAERVAKDKMVVFASDTSGDDHPTVRRAVVELNVATMVCVPLKTENHSIGVLYADAKSVMPHDFVGGRGQAMEILAEQAIVAIENARMFERATNDPLTGLPNTSYFLVQLTKVMREASLEAPAGVLLLDLDAFKRVNQVAGAEAGDRALLDVATTLQDVLRADGLVARYGSDKFAILLEPESTEAPMRLRLRDVAERARAAVAAKTFHGVQLSACIGGVIYPAVPGELSAQDLVALADDVLAKARARGAGHVEI